LKIISALFAVILGIFLEHLTVILRLEPLLVFPLALALFFTGLPNILFLKDWKRLKTLERLEKMLEGEENVAP
jgi:Na+-transporting methylmalonyl-CoA/oxaloacetate decarboxylase beta subunit